MHGVLGSLFLRFCEADEDLAALLADLVREDVRDIGFRTKPLVQFTRFGRADEDERDIPAGKHLRRDGGIGKTRRGAPREIGYFNLCHSI